MTDLAQRLMQWILLPVEVKMREFESKILLACFAAESGYGVLLGRRTFSGKWKQLPRGPCVCKGLCPNSVDTLVRRKEAGFQNIYLDEEGPIYPNQATYVRIRTSKEIMDYSSLFLAWGAGQAETVTGHYPGHAEKVFITGHPRVDLWRPEFREVYRDKAEALRARFGRYILIASNFAEYISANGANFAMEQARKLGVITTPEEEAVWRERVAYRGRLFHAFTEAIPQLAEAFPEVTFIIRPHPGDDHGRWTPVARKGPNIIVAFEGSISPWILGAEAVLHNSCTSGAEAYVMGREAITYQPYTDIRFDMPLPNALSAKAHDVASLKTILGRVIAGEKLRPESVRSIASRHFGSLEGKLAGERIVEVLSRLDCPTSRLEYRRHRPSIVAGVERKFREVLSHATSLVRPAKHDAAQTTTKYRQQKFSGSSFLEVSEFVKKLHDVSGRFGDLEVTELDKDMYCFLPSKMSHLSKNRSPGEGAGTE